VLIADCFLDIAPQPPWPLPRNPVRIRTGHAVANLPSGDWVYLRNHTREHKLDPKVTGSYEVLETDGRTYLIDQDGLPYRVSGDHMVPAGHVDPANRTKHPQVAVPDALQPGRSEFVL